VWLDLWKGLLELSITYSTLTTSSQYEIVNRRCAIENKLSATRVLPPKPSTYTNSARCAIHLSTEEKPYSSRSLKKKYVKVTSDSKPTHAAYSRRAGKVLATKKHERGNIVITTVSHKIRNFTKNK
jgi:hypothetical protein